MYAYVYMYVCVCVCVYVCVCVCVYVCMCLYVRIYVRICACMRCIWCIYMHMCICISLTRQSFYPRYEYNRFFSDWNTTQLYWIIYWLTSGQIQSQIPGPFLDAILDLNKYNPVLNFPCQVVGTFISIYIHCLWVFAVIHWIQLNLAGTLTFHVKKYIFPNVKNVFFTKANE